MIEYEETGECKISRDLFCIPLQDKKSDQNNEFDKEIWNFTPEVE